MKEFLKVEAWSARRTISVIAIAVALWAVVAFVNLYLFFIPCMDNWCYFAPSVLAEAPGELSTPFLGTFGGANHIWGLHWPGVPLINSALFSFLPAEPILYVAWHILLWLGVAVVVSRLTWLASRSRIAMMAALLFVLCDRALSFVAGWQRMELMSLIIASTLVAGLIKQARRERISRGQYLLLLASTFVAPLTHPIAGALTAAALAIGTWLRWREKGERLRLIFQGLALAISLAALLGWFTLRPDLLAQFKDHIGVARTTLVPGQIFFNSMREIYSPLFTGPLFYGGGTVLALVVVVRFWKRAEREKERPERDVIWALAWLALGIASALNIFKNAYYLVFLLLPLCPLFALAARTLRTMSPAVSRLRQPTVVVTLLFLIGVHGAFWITRSLKWCQAGRPNLRQELHHFWTTLPQARHLYIPEALWEQAVQSPKAGSEILMNTIVNNSSIERRRAYEAYAYVKVERGDLLILDDCQSNSPATALQRARWEPTGSATNHPPGQMKWGYGFTVYRAR